MCLIQAHDVSEQPGWHQASFYCISVWCKWEQPLEARSPPGTGIYTPLETSWPSCTLKLGDVSSHCFDWADLCSLSLISLPTLYQSQGWTRSPELRSTLLPSDSSLFEPSQLPADPTGLFMAVSSIRPAVSGLRAVSGNCLFPTTTLHPPRSCLIPGTHCSFLSHLVKRLMLVHSGETQGNDCQTTRRAAGIEKDLETASVN